MRALIVECEASQLESSQAEAELIRLVLDGVTSLHSRRSYRTGLEAFFDWASSTGEVSAFSKALLQQYRSTLLATGLSSATVNLRLSPAPQARPRDGRQPAARTLDRGGD